MTQLQITQNLFLAHSKLMFNKRYLSAFLTFLCVVLFVSCSREPITQSQLTPVGNRKSPISISSIKHEGTYIKVVYGQPYRNGRTIFGDWEPYDQVWRTGANEATEITFTEPVFMGDDVVEAGTYALFTIPNTVFMKGWRSGTMY